MGSRNIYSIQKDFKQDDIQQVYPEDISELLACKSEEK